MTYINISVSSELLNQLEGYQSASGTSDLTQAISELIQLGLERVLSDLDESDFDFVLVEAEDCSAVKYFPG